MTILEKWSYISQKIVLKLGTPTCTRKKWTRVIFIIFSKIRHFGDLDIEPFSITWQNLLSPHGLLTTRQFWKMTLQNEKNGQWEQFKKKVEKQPIVESKWNCQVLLTVVSSTTREDFRSPHRPAIKWHFRQTHLHKKEKRGNKSNLNIFFQNQSVDSLELNFRNL